MSSPQERLGKVDNPVDNRRRALADAHRPTEAGVENKLSVRAVTIGELRTRAERAPVEESESRSGTSASTDLGGMVRAGPTSATAGERVLWWASTGR
jgi:hypothetical protein